MHFLVDAQLPPVLARALSSSGHPSHAVRDLDLREAEDDAIWDYARSHQLAIVTKDEDFALRVWRTSDGPAIVWLRFGNCSNKKLLEQLMPFLDEIVERINLGDRLIEVS